MADNMAHESPDTASIENTTNEKERTENLENFPVKILVKIFIRTNNIGLLHLVETCTKFAAIAQGVFAKRYANQYFIVNGYNYYGDPDYYLATFKHFDSNINALQFNHVDFWDEDDGHYIEKILQPHANHIQRLTFDSCSLITTNQLPQFENITHLVFRNSEVARLPECGNSIKLEIRGQHILLTLQMNYHLLNFCHLSIETNDQISCSILLPLFIKYPSFEKITIIYNDYSCVYPDIIISPQFFDEFIETIIMAGKPNARIDIEMDGRIIGSVTTNGIIWCNKLMYWNGCNENSSNIHLLHLADHPEKFNGSQMAEGAKEDAVELNLLDRIFDYLDIESLRLFADSSKQSRQLVKSYVKKHLERHDWFTATDEFYPAQYDDFFI